MKIVIPGGSGQIGTVLARAFAQDGHDVTVLSRRFPDNLKHAGQTVNPHEMAQFHEVAGPGGESGSGGRVSGTKSRPTGRACWKARTP